MRFSIFAALLLFPTQPEAAESDLFAGLTVSQTYPRATITHYSATPRGGPVCPYEGGVGGRDESPSGFRPLSHRIDKPGKIHGRMAVLTAIPQQGGNSGMFNCFFALPEAYPGKLFYAGDRYGPDSNGKVKVDVSSPCTTIVNKTMKSKIVVYNCKGKKGGFPPPIKREPATPKPEPSPAPGPAPAPGNQEICGHYAIFACYRSAEAAQSGHARLGASGLSVVRSDSIPNFTPGWHCIVSGPHDAATAAAKVRSLRNRAPTGYVKRGC